MTFFLGMTLLCVLIQAIIALFEMACVSFHRVRLHYYVSLNRRRARWLHYLIERPSRLFGTTLIGILTALQIGSECSRRWYESMGWNPDLAPLSQIIIVVVFAELVPMFAGRSHPERIAMALVPWMMVLTRILSPLIWAFDALSRLIHRCIGTPQELSLYLSRDEVRAAFEEHEEVEEEWNAVVSRIFSLKSLTARDIMIPLNHLFMIPEESSLADLRHQLPSGQLPPVIPLYHHVRHRITGVVQIRDLLALPESAAVHEGSRPPWFVIESSSILRILEQFRSNNQSAAVILQESGRACGLLTLDQILAQIFGEEEDTEESRPRLFVERTLSASMTVGEFNREFQASIGTQPDQTLSDLLCEAAGHLPVKGEEVEVEEFAFTIEELTFRGVKTCSVKNI